MFLSSLKLPANAVTLLSALALGCAASWQVRDVLELPPPADLRAERKGRQITISWRAYPSDEVLDFSGYLLYFASRSQARTPFDQMPPPVEIPPEATQFTLEVADSLPVFIHMRSRAGGKKISLPTVPELIMPPLHSSTVEDSAKR